MDNAQIVQKILEIGGTAGVLWVAIWWLAKSLREQYEHRIKALEDAADSRGKQYENRIDALEQASHRCEVERQKLSSEVIDIHKQQNTHNRQEIKLLHELLEREKK